MHSCRFFPFPANEDTVSHPLKAWNTGKVQHLQVLFKTCLAMKFVDDDDDDDNEHLWFPITGTTSWTAVTRVLRRTPKWTEGSVNGIRSKNDMARTTTSVLTVLVIICLWPHFAAWKQCKIKCAGLFMCTWAYILGVNNSTKVHNAVIMSH